jgi:hypothetical protein
VWTGRATDPSDASIEQQCTYNLAAGYDACTVRETNDGVPAMDTVDQVFWREDGPGRPYQNLSGFRGVPVRAGAGIDTSKMSSWYEHTLDVVRPDSSQTLVTESVRADDLATARTLFRVDAGAMAELAADPALAIPPAPSAGPGCGSWTLIDHGQACKVTDADIATAEALLPGQAAAAGGGLTSARLWVTAGTLLDRPTGSCDSGRLLHLALTARQNVQITADAASGTVCRTQTLRGDHAPNLQYTTPLDITGVTG